MAGGRLMRCLTARVAGWPGGPAAQLGPARCSSAQTQSVDLRFTAGMDKNEAKLCQITTTTTKKHTHTKKTDFDVTDGPAFGESGGTFPKIEKHMLPSCAM